MPPTSSISPSQQCLQSSLTSAVHNEQQLADRKFTPTGVDHLLGIVLQAALPGFRRFACRSYGFWIFPVIVFAACSCLAYQGLLIDESLERLNDLHAHHEQSDTT